MFNSTFYPTPRKVGKRMIAPWNFQGQVYLLDPEAGKADLLDMVKESFRSEYVDTYGGWSKLHLYACEIENDLRSIIEGKGYPLVGRDFLEYVPTMHFTHVLMNPPFSYAEDHLLHAWEILSSGEIACLLPTRMLVGDPNQKTAKEQLIIRLIQDHSLQPPEHLGSIFKDAERTTNEEISIVWLTKPSDYKDFGFDVHNDNASEERFDNGTQELALGGFVDNLLQSFDAAVRHYAGYNRSRQDVLRYVAPFAGIYDPDNEKDRDHNGIMDTADQCENPQERYNKFVGLLQSAAWSSILEHPLFKSMMTDRARKMIREFGTRQKRVDFNRENVAAMFDALTLKRDELLNAAILDAFDTMTKYHKENRVHVEGWKSDLAWKVNHRVVLPNFVDFSWGGFRTNYSRRDELNDIDRAMCILSGKRFNEVLTIESALEQKWKADSWTPGVCESEFFKCRFFKKETIHLTFLDMKLLEDFNLAAARGKNWLPPGE